MGSEVKRFLAKEEGIVEEDRVLYVKGYRHLSKIAQALASDTRTMIIQILASGPKTLDELSEMLGQSKANISSQIRKLEEIGIVVPKYQPGERGIKKTVELRIKSINLILSDE
ncbi:MAG: winged helix-turn-helix domain-containing protein [Aeropyrum sp.]|nr:winged helix-turn-helix domain-containing protein [Aeropyrum sp.]MCE4615627.1 winged helix-turn-helix domain-containing protein [Aeropyrum sp.]